MPAIQEHLVIYSSTSLGTCLAKLILSIEDLNTTLIKQKKNVIITFHRT